MFTKKHNTKDKALDTEIQEVLSEMRDINKAHPDYETHLDKLERLYKLKLNIQHEKKTVSPDALVAAGASIAGIVMILGFEQANVLTSKAMSFVFKPKV